MSDGSALERLVAAARAKATAGRHSFIGTEHLMAALLDDPTGLAAMLVQRTGMDPGRLATDLLVGLKQSPDTDGTRPEPALSSLAERAISGATQESDVFRRLIGSPKGKIAILFGADPKVLPALRAALEPDRPKQAERTDPASAPPPRSERAKPARDGPKERRGEQRDQRQRNEADRRRQPAEPRSSRPLPPVDPRPPRLAVRPHTERRPFPWSMLLLIAVPGSVVLNWLHASPVLVFFIACIAVLPLAGLMGEATESLAERTGPTVGGLLNATFGNAAELIIALAALRSGLVDLVKASIIGSILGNLLLILGLAMIAGGGKNAVVKFNRNNAGMSSAMLALAVVGLLFPAVFHAVHGPPNQAAELHLSEIVSGILIATYLCSLLFSLKTHRALFGGGDHPAVEPRWRVVPSVAVLALATLGVVVESEILVHTVEAVTASLGWSQVFLGLVIVPLIGNAAEHATAVVVARKGQIDLAFQIALGSSTQVALLIAPILVFAGLLYGGGMNLVFPVFDVAALAVSTVVIAIITLDGETHWFEGVQLLAVYAMVAAAAFFI